MLPDAFPWFGLIFLFVIALWFASSSFFIVHTKQANVVERLGKFDRIAGPGLNFKVPLLEKKVYVEDLNMQLMDVPVMSKTKDDATVTVPVRVQYSFFPIA
jgi:regulator of protease activity HflC (stomatin/prohibitin superfamily)